MTWRLPRYLLEVSHTLFEHRQGSKVPVSKSPFSSIFSPRVGPDLWMVIKVYSADNLVQNGAEKWWCMWEEDYQNVCFFIGNLIATTYRWCDTGATGNIPTSVISFMSKWRPRYLQRKRNEVHGVSVCNSGSIWKNQCNQSMWPSNQATTQGILNII